MKSAPAEIQRVDENLAEPGGIRQEPMWGCQDPNVSWVPHAQLDSEAWGRRDLAVNRWLRSNRGTNGCVGSRVHVFMGGVRNHSVRLARRGDDGSTYWRCAAACPRMVLNASPRVRSRRPSAP